MTRCQPLIVPGLIGVFDGNGNLIAHRIKAAENPCARWEMTVRNPGGHSSRPREDNAIYDLPDAIKTIQDHRFPLQWSEMTLEYFQHTGEQIGGEVGDAMIASAYDPWNEVAAARLTKKPSYIGTTRTTCVVSMLKSGGSDGVHLRNAGIPTWPSAVFS